MLLTDTIDLHVKPKLEFKYNLILKLGKCVIQNNSNMESKNGIEDLGFDLSHIRHDDIPKVLSYLIKKVSEVNRKLDKLILGQKGKKGIESEESEENSQLDAITQKLEKIELLASINPKDKDQLEELTQKLKRLEARKPEDHGNYWMNIKELTEYLPSHPAEATVYGWTMRKKIPFHKVGKKVQFLQSEIDDWMENKRIDNLVKTDAEIQAEAEEYIKKKRLEDQEKRIKKL